MGFEKHCISNIAKTIPHQRLGTEWLSRDLGWSGWARREAADFAEKLKPPSLSETPPVK